MNREWRLPEAVRQNRPPTSPAETAEVVALFDKFDELRRTYINVLASLFIMDALGVALGELEASKTWPSFDGGRMLRGQDHARLERQRKRRLGPGERRFTYWSPSKIAQPYASPIDHAFSEKLVGDLLDARERVLERIRGSPEKRYVLEREIPRFQEAFVALRAWVQAHTKRLSNRSAVTKTVAESSANILAETASFIVHFINAFIDAALIDLPRELSESDQPKVLPKLGSLGFLERTIRFNYRTLLMLPAALSPTDHRRMLRDGVVRPGSAHPVWPRMLVARPAGDRLGLDPVLTLSWEPARSDLDPKTALQLTRALRNAANHGSKCGGLRIVFGCDPRSRAIVEAANCLLPGSAWDRMHLNPIAMVTLLACRNLGELAPRIVRTAPGPTPSYRPRFPKDWFEAADELDFGMVRRPSRPAPEQVDLAPDDCHFPLRFPMGLRLDRWRGDDALCPSVGWLVGLRQRATGGRVGDWQPPGLRRSKDADDIQAWLRRAAEASRSGREVRYEISGGRPLGQVAFRQRADFPLRCEMELWISPEATEREVDRILAVSSTLGPRIFRARELVILTPPGDGRLKGYVGFSRQSERGITDDGWEWALESCRA